jgi:hypothetical protein
MRTAIIGDAITGDHLKSDTDGRIGIVGPQVWEAAGPSNDARMDGRRRAEIEQRTSLVTVRRSPITKRPSPPPCAVAKAKDIDRMAAKPVRRQAFLSCGNPRRDALGFPPNGRASLIG